MGILAWLDAHQHTKSGKLANQLLPVTICVAMLIGFVALTYLFIVGLINPWSTEVIRIELHAFDVCVGFFLYFLTAVDYALIVGRMQINNPGSKARVIMNVGTCLGCFVGVSLVLFLWGFAKEIPALIIVLLIFAGSVMIKLAYEGIEYFQDAKEIPSFVRFFVVSVLKILHAMTTIFTFWIPDLGSPNVVRMSAASLAKWSFFLPFIIGLDDLVGYMGAMTIYNVFSLLVGIYLADILVDILIFVSPRLTKRLVENAYLSLIAAFAFLYLGYKSYSEAFVLLHEAFLLPVSTLLLLAIVGAGVGFSFWKMLHNRHAIEHA